LRGVGAGKEAGFIFWAVGRLLHFFWGKFEIGIIVVIVVIVVVVLVLVLVLVFWLAR